MRLLVVIIALSLMHIVTACGESENAASSPKSVPTLQRTSTESDLADVINALRRLEERVYQLDSSYTGSAWNLEQRLTRLEERVSRLDDPGGYSGSVSSLEQRLSRLEGQVSRLDNPGGYSGSVSNLEQRLNRLENQSANSGGYGYGSANCGCGN